MKDLVFLHPERWAFLLLPVLISLLGLLVLRQRRRDLARFADVGAHPLLLVDRGPRRRGLRLVLDVLGLLLLSLAALEPALGFTMVDVERRGVDAVICLDTSRSMNARDLSPSRGARARQQLRSLLPELRGDRIALVAFAGDAKVICPLTHDLGAFEGLLADVDDKTTRVGGTNLGAALRTALAMLPADQETSQVIFVLTDGEDLEGKGRREAERARRRGIRVHAVGFGSAVGAEIPDDQSGDFLVDEAGKRVISRMDAQELRELTRDCGGEFLPADAVLNPLVEIFQKRVRPMHQRRFEAQKRRRRKSRYQWLLLPGLLCLLLSFADPGRTRFHHAAIG